MRGCWRPAGPLCVAGFGTLASHSIKPLHVYEVSISAQAVASAPAVRLLQAGLGKPADPNDPGKTCDLLAYEGRACAAYFTCS